jgi:hypothetical protein
MNRHRLTVLLVLIVLLATLTLSATVVAPAASSPPSNLTSKGRTLWEFEALLHDQFGSRPVSAHYRPGWWWNFAACPAGCAPLSYWNIYFFTFTHAHDSAFHLSSRRTRPEPRELPATNQGEGSLCRV